MLYAQLAIESARSIDNLYRDSMMSALAVDLLPEEMHAMANAREDAIKALNDYADWLEKRLPAMPAFAPMGETNYNYLLKHVYLLPLDAKQVEMLGQTELARARASESMLPDPSLADPDPQRAKVVPKNQDDFLKAYESRQAEMIAFLKERKLVTLPSYLGRFEIRQLPEAFKPTSPGGFMNAPGVYERMTAASISFRLTIRKARTSTFGQPLKTRGRFWVMKESQATFYSFRSPIT